MIQVNRSKQCNNIPTKVPFLIYSRKYDIHYLAYEHVIGGYSIIRIENGVKQNYESGTIKGLIESLKHHDIEIIEDVTISY